MKRAALYLTHFGLPAAAFVFLLEGLGIPIPVEFPLIVIAERLSHRPDLYWEMVLLMWSTTVVGNTVGYFMGYYGGRPLALKFMRWLRISETTWDKLEGWFRNHGLKMIVFTRWINWGFAHNIWLCGITRVPPVKFFIIMVVNDFLWAMGWTWLGMVGWSWIKAQVGPYFRQLARTLHVSPSTLGCLLFALVFGIVIWVWLHRKRRARNTEVPAMETEDPT